MTNISLGQAFAWVVILALLVLVAFRAPTVYTDVYSAVTNTTIHTTDSLIDIGNRAVNP